MQLHSPGGRGSRSGFSLIETLVVIGVTGVLFSIVFPALMRSRAAAGQTRSLVNCREIAMAFESFASARSGAYPACRSDMPYQMATAPGGAMSISGEARARWETRSMWPGVIDDVAPIAENWQAWISPGSGVDATGYFTPHYMFSNSFVAAPQLWTSGFEPDASDVLRDVRRHEVRFPSRKAMIWDAVMAYVHPSARPSASGAAGPMPIAFADGHAGARRYSEASVAVPNVLNDQRWRETRMHNTAEGVRGSDF